MPRVTSPRVRLETDLLLISTAGIHFGFPVKDVKGVGKLPSLTPIPLAKPFVAGLCNFAGYAVPAISFAKLMGVQENPKGMLVVVEHPSGIYALIVDDVCGVEHCEGKGFPKARAKRNFNGCLGEAIKFWFKHKRFSAVGVVDLSLLGSHQDVLSLYSPRKAESLPPEKRFWFKGGGSAGNLKELLEWLKTAPEEYFEYHARNKDFSKWLGEVLKKKGLAASLETVSSRKAAIALIERACQGLTLL